MINPACRPSDSLDTLMGLGMVSHQTIRSSSRNTVITSYIEGDRMAWTFYSSEELECQRVNCMKCVLLKDTLTGLIAIDRHIDHNCG